MNLITGEIYIRRILLRVATAFAVVASVAACSSMETMKPMQGQSLYTRPGGKPAITAVVDNFNSRINRRFANADIPHLKMELADQICAARAARAHAPART
jgi:hypothetical protein